MELQIGMWIRTKHGRVCQVNKINEVPYLRTAKTREVFDALYKGRSRPVINGRYELEDIVLVSNSILGDDNNHCLLKIGDYVNGEKIIDCYPGYAESIKTTFLSDDRIKTIAPKEQFKKIEYDVWEGK